MTNPELADLERSEDDYDDHSEHTEEGVQNLSSPIISPMLDYNKLAPLMLPGSNERGDRGSERGGERGGGGGERGERRGIESDMSESDDLMSDGLRRRYLVPQGQGGQILKGGRVPSIDTHDWNGISQYNKENGGSNNNINNNNNSNNSNNNNNLHKNHNHDNDNGQKQGLGSGSGSSKSMVSPLIMGIMKQRDQVLANNTVQFATPAQSYSKSEKVQAKKERKRNSRTGSEGSLTPQRSHLYAQDNYVSRPRRTSSVSTLLVFIESLALPASQWVVGEEAAYSSGTSSVDDVAQRRMSRSHFTDFGKCVKLGYGFFYFKWRH